MRSLRPFLMIIVLATTVIAGKELSIGANMPLPDYVMNAVGGTEVTLNSAMGDAGLVVIFSCNTCPWVRKWEDRYVSISDAFTPKGFGLIAINPNEGYRDKGDSFDDMIAHAEESGYNFTYALDKNARLATEFGASHTPHVFVFDAEGSLVYRGAIDDNARDANDVENEYLADALNAMLAGQTVAQSSTKSMGCSIKFPN